MPGVVPISGGGGSTSVITIDANNYIYVHDDGKGNLTTWHSGELSADPDNELIRGADGGLYYNHPDPEYSRMWGRSGAAALEPLQYQVWQELPSTMLLGAVTGATLDATTGYPILEAGDWEMSLGVFDGDTSSGGWNAAFRTRPFGTILGYLRLRTSNSTTTRFTQSAQTFVSRSRQNRFSMQAPRSTVQFKLDAPETLVLEYMNMDNAMTGMTFRVVGLDINVKRFL